MKLKFKKIYTSKTEKLDHEITGNDLVLFLIRVSLYLKAGSIKLHIMFNDDKTEPHTHPWGFSSFILFGGYIETTYPNNELSKDTLYGMFSVNRKTCNEYHRVRLRRFLGIKIPCVTIGRYTEKKQLCSLCTKLGYCKTTGKPV